MPGRSTLSVELDAETTAVLLGEVPAAFHAGVQDVLLIAFGLAVAEFLGTGGRSGGHRRRGSWPCTRNRRAGGSVAHGGLVHHQVSGVAGRGWVVLGAGRSPVRRRWARWSRTPRSSCGRCRIRLSYGLLRYLNDDVDLDGSRTPHRLQLPRPPRIPGRRLDFRRGGGRYPRTRCRRPALPWRSPWRWRTPSSSMPSPSTPTRARTCRPTGRGRRRRSTNPRSKRLSQLWFEALTGICAHVRNGGGGLTPSDVAPARLSQQQIDELQLQDEIADILPLTPLQQGLLFHAGTAPASGRHVCGPARLHLGRSTRPAPAARRGADGRHPPSTPGGPVPPAVRRAGAGHPGRAGRGVAVRRPQRKWFGIPMN